jgi:hypothetical protein
MNISNINRVRFVLALAISLAILGFLFYKIDVAPAFEVIRTGDRRLMALACLLSLAINVFLGAFKWRMILGRMGCGLTQSEALSIRSACIPFNVVFPMKSSELLKASYLRLKKGIPFARGVSSILVDKVLNIFVTLCLFLVGLSLAEMDIPRYAPAAVALAILAILLSGNIGRISVGLSGRINPRFGDFTKELFRGFEKIDLRGKITLFFYSLIFQLSEFVNTYILFKAVGVSVPFSLVLVYIPVAMVINNAPVTIMGIGTREALLVFFFARYGVPGELLGGGILVSLVEYVLPAAAGLFFMKSFLEYMTIRPDMVPGERGRP